MSVGLAFRAFFSILFRPDVAARVRPALDSIEKTDSEPKKIEEKTAKVVGDSPKQQTNTPKRSEALTLLSALQRESRLLDLIMEPLEDFTDVQIGAASREVLRDSRKTLQRMFSIEPLSNSEEGAKLDLPESPSPAKYRLIGSAAAGSRRATVAHRGWQATKCDLPKWTGSTIDSQILSPIEVE
jgi:hypothetical protein